MGSSLNQKTSLKQVRSEHVVFKLEWKYHVLGGGHYLNPTILWCHSCKHSFIYPRDDNYFLAISSWSSSRRIYIVVMSYCSPQVSLRRLRGKLKSDYSTNWQHSRHSWTLVTGTFNEQLLAAEVRTDLLQGHFQKRIPELFSCIKLSRR